MQKPIIFPFLIQVYHTEMRFEENMTINAVLIWKGFLNYPFLLLHLVQNNTMNKWLKLDLPTAEHTENTGAADAHTCSVARAGWRMEHVSGGGSSSGRQEFVIKQCSQPHPHKGHFL